jgi:hypothetical protein
MNVINTHEPSTGPIGAAPMPEVPADVIGVTGYAQGKSVVGK